MSASEGSVLQWFYSLLHTRAVIDETHVFLQPPDSQNDGPNTNALQREGGSQCYQKSRLTVCYLPAVVKPGLPLETNWTEHTRRPSQKPLLLSKAHF